MKRRWEVGMSVSTGDGLSWRVAPGAKSPRDLVLEVRTANGWRNVKMAAGFLMADFLAENEDVLVADGYFPAASAGADYYLEHLRIAATDGWKVAAGRLDSERQARRQRSAQRVVEPVQVRAPRLCPSCRGWHSVGTTCGERLPMAAGGEDLF